ncbi:unnamed protein product [Miscanthus lutarioriparius]|uniref:Cytosol aminopeptidase domain-containing protein n=1 Tax=Miscanthus lutarioriparius TaxID=422564 RepID=A0A811PNK9_9POAL|nr:unnamed protein product [Miscanthus lutarioriparius]
MALLPATMVASGPPPAAAAWSRSRPGQGCCTMNIFVPAVDLLLPSPAEKNKISKNAGAGEIFFHQLLIQEHLSASIHELRPDDKAQLGSFAVLEINLDIRAVKRKLAIVGKGLTFDSGGYNIMTGPGCSIELMKLDMGGSAAVFGAAKALGQIKPLGVEVHFLM